MAPDLPTPGRSPRRPARTTARRAAVLGAALTLSVVAGWLAVARARTDAARTAGATVLQQAGGHPLTAPLPHYDPAEDAGARHWVIPLTFASRTQMTAGTVALSTDRAHIQLTAPMQLQLEAYNRGGTKIRTTYAWHPLRRENVGVLYPDAPGPRLAGARQDDGDSFRYNPNHRIGATGTGELFVPYDPRVSTIRIVDVDLGGVELGRVSVEGAARRHCAAAPASSFCRGGVGGASEAGDSAGSVSRGALYLDPYTMTVGSGAVFTVTIRARRMVDLYGGQLAVTYDPRVVQVVDQDPGRPGAQIVPGDFPKPDSVLRNAASNPTGRLEYVFTLTGEKPGVSGAGAVAHVVLRAAGVGTSRLAITETVLSDPQSLAIPTKLEHALVTVLEGPVANVTGQVELERRPTSAGARVCSGTNCTTTDAAGRFTLANAFAGRPVDVLHPSYLRTQRMLPANAAGTVAWPRVKLLAGDLDKDDRVDIVDAVMIGQRFNLRYAVGGANPRWLEACDITDDDTVNILDMTGVQFNFLKGAPTAWPTTLLAALTPAGGGARPADASQAVRVTLTPAEATAHGPDDDVALELRVDDVAKLYGYRVQLRFDPAALQVRDVSPADEGVQVALGEFLDPVNSFVLVNRADNAMGTVNVGVTQTAPATGANGSGVLAAITFRGRANGTTDVTLPEVVLVDDTEPVPATIAAERAGATITVTGITAGGDGAMIYLPRSVKPQR